jgi:hypothetical protein
LDVQVTVLENLRSGLAVDDGFRKEGPVNFTIPYSRTGSVYTDQERQARNASLVVPMCSSPSLTP